MPPTEDEVMAREEAMANLDDEALQQFMTAEEGEPTPPAAEPEPVGEPAAEPASSPEPAADPEPAQEPASEPASEPAAPAAQPEAEEAPEPAPLPQRSAPDDAAEQRKALRAEKNTAMTQLLAGEITQEAFQAIEDGVQDKLDALVRAESSDHAREQIRMDLMRDDYSKNLRAAQKELASAGLDLKGQNGAIAAEFDRAVRYYAGEAMARGLVDRPGDLAGSRDALNEAKALLLRRHGKAAPVPAAAPAPVPAPAAPKRDLSPPDRSKIPPTLANAPAARADVGEENRFAHIDAIADPIQREAAIARLSENDQERYMQG